MRDSRFDDLARNLTSRRAALGRLLGGVTAMLGLPTPEEASAHVLAPRCRKLKDAKRRRACLRRARVHARTHRCKPKPPATVCATVRRCDGLAVDNCGKLVNCTCPVGRVCTDNGSCARSCPGLGSGTCPIDCFCTADMESRNSCFSQAVASCEQSPQVCASSADCPVGSRCVATICGLGIEGQRCFALCPS
jgi:hypothetical protein